MPHDPGHETRTRRARRRAFLASQQSRAYPTTIHKRRPLRPERLHPYSSGFHDYLRTRRPEWLAHAFNVLGYEHTAFDLEIEIPHPRQGKPQGRLRLPAASILLWMNHGEELTITYVQWHTHLGLGRTPDPAADYAECVELVDKVQREEIVFVYGYEGTRLASAGAVHTDHLEEMIRRKRELRHNDSLLVRSWNGTYDRRIEPGWPG